MRNRFLVAALTIIAGLFAAQNSAEAQANAKMKYLVIGELIDPGPMMTPQQVVQMGENLINPGLDVLTKWEADKRIMGGIYVGDRKAVFIMEAESNDDVDRMIQALPFWGINKWTVSPLQSFAARAEENKMRFEKMKSMMK
jgi:hypothetical protein